MKRQWYLLFLLFSTMDSATASKPYTSDAVKFPIKTSLEGNHFLDANGMPFLMVADVAWQMLRKLDQASVVKYLDIRKSQSFNTVLLHALPITPSQKNYYKKTPFIGGNIAKINPEYFQHLEKIIQEAKARDIAVGVVVNRFGWKDILNDINFQSYLTYLKEKFGKYENVIWLFSEGVNTNENTETLVDKTNPQLSAELFSRIDSFQNRQNNSKFQFDIIIPDSTNTVKDLANLSQSLRETNRIPSKPLILANTEIPKTIFDGSYLIRQQSYNALNLSVGGYCFQSTIKNFLPTWLDNIKNDGAEYITRLVHILQQVPWPYLVPERSGKFCTFDTTENKLNIELLPNKRLALLYLENSKDIYLNLAYLVGEKFNIVWYSPRTGKRWKGGYVDSGSNVRFTPPEKNEVWDWVLLIGSTQ